MFQEISHPIFTSEFPSRKNLIDYTTKKLFLRWTKSKDHRECLNSLVDSYLDFVQERDLQEYNGKFWISDEQMIEFPEDSFKISLQIFFSDETVWKRSSAEFMRHEHLRVLFFIAALRYRRLQEPKQQIKFKEGNWSEGGIIDLFLFDREKLSPVYALQIRLLTRFDMDKRGSIHETRRTSEFWGKGINTFNKYIKESERVFKSCLPSLDSESGTKGFVVLVTPYGMVWIDCGRYSETAISQLIDQDSSLQSQHNLQNQQSQENMLNFGSQNNNFVAPLMTERRPNLLQQIHEDYERKERKREADRLEALSVLSSVTHYSAIPSRDSDSWAGIHYPIQPMPSIDQQSNHSWQTNWHQYNGLPQYPMMQYPNQGMVQPLAFQSNLGPPMIAIPNPNQFAYSNYPYHGYAQQFNQGNGWMPGGY